MRTIGTKSNRSGIGAPVEMRHESGGRDQAARADRRSAQRRRLFFAERSAGPSSGLGKAEKVDLLEIRWPSGHVDAHQRREAQPDRVCERRIRNHLAPCPLRPPEVRALTNGQDLAAQTTQTTALLFPLQFTLRFLVSVLQNLTGDDPRHSRRRFMWKTNHKISRCLRAL